MEKLLLSVEIICKPLCMKCSHIEGKISTIVRCIGLKERIPISVRFIRNKNIMESEKYGYGVAQLPVVLMNGRVFCVGPFQSERLIRIKIEELLRNPS